MNKFSTVKLELETASAIRFDAVFGVVMGESGQAAQITEFVGSDKLLDELDRGDRAAIMSEIRAQFGRWVRRDQLRCA